MNIVTEEQGQRSKYAGDDEVQLPIGITPAQIMLDFPVKLQPLFRPKRYKVGKGGRGSAKSWGFIRALVIRAYERKTRILCCREFQNSITESVHRLICDMIDLMGLSEYFVITQTTIYCLVNGSEFIFAGIRSNPNKIKSLEGVDIAYVEEAELISRRSWEILIPTIRKQACLDYGGVLYDSEIWLVFNPQEEEDPTNQRFVVHTPPDCVIMELNWQDNPWFPDVLRREMEYDYKVEPENAAHIWEGKYKTKNAASIFADKVSVEAFTPVTKGFPEKVWDGPYYGADWGFAEDPMTLVKCWVYKRVLYIEKECYGQHVEYNDIAGAWDQTIPESKRGIVMGDNSQPATISHLNGNYGYVVKAAEKWPNSVEDGITFLRSFEKIVIHPRCKHAINEARMYSYKVDRLTKQITRDIVDKFNHIWDAVRYAVGKMIKRKNNLYKNL